MYGLTQELRDLKMITDAHEDETAINVLMQKIDDGIELNAHMHRAAVFMKRSTVSRKALRLVDMNRTISSSSDLFPAVESLSGPVPAGSTPALEGIASAIKDTIKKIVQWIKDLWNKFVGLFDRKKRRVEKLKEKIQENAEEIDEKLERSRSEKTSEVTEPAKSHGDDINTSNDVSDVTEQDEVHTPAKPRLLNALTTKQLNALGGHYRSIMSIMTILWISTQHTLSAVNDLLAKSARSFSENDIAAARERIDQYWTKNEYHYKKIQSIMEDVFENVIYKDHGFSKEFPEFTPKYQPNNDINKRLVNLGYRTSSDLSSYLDMVEMKSLENVNKTIISDDALKNLEHLSEDEQKQLRAIFSMSFKLHKSYTSCLYPLSHIEEAIIRSVSVVLSELDRS